MSREMASGLSSVEVNINSFSDLTFIFILKF